MEPQREPDWFRTTSGATERTLVSKRVTDQTENIHIRNYDHQWGYDLTIEIVAADGHLRLEKRYYLQPGQIENEVDLLPHDDYELRVTLDNDQQKTLQCRIDASPANTAVIGVGNGALSLTDGLYS